MVELELKNLLVLGVDLVSIVASARRAGYTVCSVGFFGDQDLKHFCLKSRSIIKQRVGYTCGRFSTDFEQKALMTLVRDVLGKKTIDAVLLSSGLEDSPEFLSELNDLAFILGNSPDVIKRVREKMEFFKEIKRLGMLTPETRTCEDLREAKNESRDIGYPVVFKPSRGFGGVGIRKVNNPHELNRAYQDVLAFDNKVIIQEYVSGTPASVSLISCANRAVTLTLNEQLMGVQEVGQKEVFGYCGNVVPLLTGEKVTKRCSDIARKIAMHFNLVGSNGVDLVISNEGIPYVIEVNPRFQGTSECIEAVLGLNLVETHVKACVQDILPTVIEKTSTFCVRLILFAQKKLVVPDLSIFGKVRDIPLRGTIIEEGEPICSIVTEGVDKYSSLRKARELSDLIRGTLRYVSNP